MKPLRALALVFLLLTTAVVAAQSGFNGKWRGETPSGRPIQLELKTAEKTATGTLELAGQKADLTEGQVDGEAMSFKVTIDGRTIVMEGRLVSGNLELSSDDIPEPVVLKHAK